MFEVFGISVSWLEAIQGYLHLTENDKKDTAELASFGASFGVTD
jgi:hypothetical protein